MITLVAVRSGSGKAGLSESPVGMEAFPTGSAGWLDIWGVPWREQRLHRSQGPCSRSPAANHQDALAPEVPRIP